MVGESIQSGIVELVAVSVMLSFLPTAFSELVCPLEHFERSMKLSVMWPLSFLADFS